jgi:uncharacterized protein
MLIPATIPALAPWPFGLLVPVFFYVLLILALPFLRYRPGWLCIGKIDWSLFSWVIVTVLISSGALIGWYLITKPDLAPYIKRVPVFGTQHWLVVGILFALINSVSEEIICRGIIFEALTANFGQTSGLIMQALIFGALHWNGFPQGYVGTTMAAAYGLILGWLRLREGGLFACSFTHFFADAIIFAIVTLGAGR